MFTYFIGGCQAQIENWPVTNHVSLQLTGDAVVFADSSTKCKWQVMFLSRVCSPCDKGLIPGLGSIFFPSVVIASWDKLYHVASKFCISLRNNNVRKELHKMEYLQVSSSCFNNLFFAWKVLIGSCLNFRGLVFLQRFGCRSFGTTDQTTVLFLRRLASTLPSNRDICLLLFGCTWDGCNFCLHYDIWLVSHK